MFTGLTGLLASARNLDVIGNNIANVNTTAFKSSRMLFATQFSRTLSSGTQPGATTGGTNPTQVGLGVQIAGTQRNFTTGSISPTGDPRDMAIDGNGFFVVQRGGQTLYTRAGSFRANTANELVVGGSGERLMGFGVDADFNVVPGALRPVSIPVGTMTLAEATENVRMTGNLNAGGNVSTIGSVTSFGAVNLIAGATPAPTPPNVVEPTSLASDLVDPATPTARLLPAGSELRMTGARKGSTNLPTASLSIGAATTVQDVLDFLNRALGINTGAGPNPDGRTPGAAIDPATGEISVTGNIGSVNTIDLQGPNLAVVDPAGTTTTPFTLTQAQNSDGESVRTNFIAFDSLGNEIRVALTLTLVSKQGGNGTTWRYFAESPDNRQPSPVIGTGTLDFDANGRLLSNPSFPLTVDRTGTGAVTPLTFSLDVNSQSGGLTALRDLSSSIASTFQDGAPIGTLSSYSVGQNGIITGGFTNGLTRTLGQIALATFANPEGLVELGGNMFSTGPNSGNAVVGEPLTLGAGKISAGALELSNVDLSQEFINMILATTGYSAASRVITTTDQLVQQLLTIGR
jgi:flagellar hook protein FlgE